MEAEFEVKHKDLLGRVGVFQIGGKKVETPAFVPVINPVSQVIPAKDIKQMFGSNIVITNAYVLFKRLREEAANKGVHEIIGFDGVVMTDSGGYQVLMYGDVDASPADIALFQEAIRSDIAVPLDRPTGVVNRRVAERTVEETLANVRLTMDLVGRGGRCVWVGPIQGGVYRDLVARCVQEYLQLGFSVYCLGSPTPFMTAYRYKQLVSMISTARKYLGPVKPLHLFGAGHPMVFGLTIALGVDLFDSASYALFAKEGRYMTADGTLKIDNLAYFPCSCRVCLSHSPKELKSLDEAERFKLLSLHNLHICFEEVKAVKQAIWEGRLFEYLERKAKSHPSLYDAFRHVFTDDEVVSSMAYHTPMTKRRGLFLFDRDSLLRPEYRRMVERIERFPMGRCEVAVVVGCRVASGWNLSYLLEKVGEVVGSRDFEIFVAGTPFGLVPLPLFHVYPISQTNFTTSLMKSLEKELFKKAGETLSKTGCEKIFVHDLGPDIYPGFLRDLARHLQNTSEKEVLYVAGKKRLNTPETI